MVTADRVAISAAAAAIAALVRKVRVALVPKVNADPVPMARAARVVEIAAAAVAVVVFADAMIVAVDSAAAVPKNVANFPRCPQSMLILFPRKKASNHSRAKSN